MIHLALFLLIMGSSYAHECHLIGSMCILNGVRTNRTNWLFHPTSTNNTKITHVLLDNSVMPVLTDELCKTFPNLQSLTLDDISLETITPNALHECKNLSSVSFYQNKVEKINVQTFEMNYELQHLILQNNSLRYFDGRALSSLKKLRHLSLSDNFLRELDLSSFPVIETLTELDIYVNNLKDLDVFLLVEKFPNLKNIFMHNNLFPCDRLLEILVVLRIHGVQIKEWEKAKGSRNKNLPTIENVECVPPVRVHSVSNVPSAPRDTPKAAENNTGKYTLWIIVAVVGAIIFAAYLGSRRKRSSRSYRGPPGYQTKTTSVSVCCYDSD